MTRGAHDNTEVTIMSEENPSDNERRAQLQSRHIDEQIELGRRHDVRKNTEEENLQQFYYPFEEELQSRIETLLNYKLEQTGLRGYLYNYLHGLEAKEEIELAQKSLDNSRMRTQEKLNAVNLDTAEEKYQLECKQFGEFNALEVKLTKADIPSEREYVLSEFRDAARDSDKPIDELSHSELGRSR